MKATVAKYRHYGLKIYEVDSNHSYAVGTDGQATEACRQYIRDSLWAFRPEFLASYTPDGVDAEILSIIIDKKCEDATEIIARLVGDRLGDLIDDAISADGRGHFLSSYDGEERDAEDIDGLPRGKHSLAYRI